MATKVKLTVTVGRELVDELDREAKKRKLSRSALVEEAIRLLKKRQLEQALRKGYEDMSEENLRVAEEAIRYGSEAMDEE